MTKRVRRYDISLSCINCGGFFSSSRADAKFCSAKCRKQLNRADKKLSDDMDLLAASLEGYCNQFKNRREQMVEQLIKLKRVLDAKIDRYDY